MGNKLVQSEAKERGIEIKHALNGGEQRISGHYVDGYHEESRTVFEFHGCYWHGCPTHFPDRNRVQHHQCLTMHQLYILTIGKKEELQKAGYQVVELWECDYDKRCKEDPDFRSLVDSEFTNLDPLRPRDALFGGRTNSTKLYQEIDESSNEEIKYIDVCSLYPTICKYGQFPLGHPTIYSQENIDKDNIRQYCGLIKCKVLPPTNLYHPVLPQKCSQKLMFPFLEGLTHLSNKCRKKMIQESPKEVIDCVGECCINLIKGNVRLTNAQKNQLRARKQHIRLLSSKQVPLDTKKKIINQKGGALLGLLLKPLIAPIIGSVLGEIIKK